MSEEDWAQTNDDELNSLKELMRINISRQDDIQVGIFWYDSNLDDLFGVVTADAEDVKFRKSALFDVDVKTCSPLERDTWRRHQFHRKDKRFQGDYTLVPRGRVFYVKNKGPVVIVGDWIDEYPSAKEQILIEFNLPQSTEFRKDVHWNIGHGWSDKFM